MDTYFHLLPAEVIEYIDLFIPTSKAKAKQLANYATNSNLILRYCSKCGENHQPPETCKQMENKLKMKKACINEWTVIDREGCVCIWVGYSDKIAGITFKFRMHVFHSDIEDQLNYPALNILKDDTVIKFTKHNLVDVLNFYEFL